MKFLIKTLEGLESVLAKELESIMLSDIQVLRRAVSCSGNWAQLYKCNYLLSTALRVLVTLEEFELSNQDDLYSSIRSIDWKNYIPKNKTIAINGTVSGELFNHSQFAIYRTKDAIVDQLLEVYGKRPNVNTDKPDVLIDIYIRDNKLVVSLDSSGRSLHIRNYKYRQYKAPLNEVLAAGILAIAEWDGNKDFHDPMCGSGTFVTEALLKCARIPASYFNPKFAFQNWTEYHEEIWKAVKESADALIQHPEIRISASDINPLAVRDVKKNLQKFPFREKIRIFQQDFFRMEGRPGVSLFINPPYNKRISVDDPFAFYKSIGDALKSNWKGSEAWIITANIDAMKHLGLHATNKHTLNHGGTEARLLNYTIYEGSKKSKYKKS